MRTGLLWGVLLAVGCTGGSPPPGDTGLDDTGLPDTEPPDTGDPSTATCDPTETPTPFYCQSALCNLCEEDCTTLDELLPTIEVCDYTYAYGCCEMDSCTDPVLGEFDRVACPDGGYGTTYWWFEPDSGKLTGYAWSTDYNGMCDGASFGELFGPDLTSCQ